MGHFRGVSTRIHKIYALVKIRDGSSLPTISEHPTFTEQSMNIPYSTNKMKNSMIPGSRAYQRPYFTPTSPKLQIIPILPS